MDTKEFESYVKKIQSLAENEFEKMQENIEKTNVFPQEFYEIAKENDLYRCALPKEFGGFGLTEKQILQVQEAFSRGPGGIRMHLHYAMDLNWRILYEYGSEELKKEYMNKFADKEIFTCFALTEKEGGTGADIKTKAVLHKIDESKEDGDIDNEYFVLNGEKTLISHTDCSNFAYIIAVTDETAEKDRRLSAFFVPTDTLGYEAIPMPHLMGCRGAGHAHLKFTNMKVPRKFLLGEIGDGLKISMHSLSVSRAHIAVSNLGMAQKMLEMSIKRANDRVTFGKPLSSRQIIKGYLADMATHIHALRCIVYDYAADFDNGKDSVMKASIAKLFSINTVKLVSDYMLLIFGGIGYFSDNEYGAVERMYRDCRALFLEEGTPAVQQITITREIIESGGKIV